MSIRPFNLGSLPRLPPADFGAARRAAARLGMLPRRMQMTVAPFGDLTLAVSSVGAASPPADSDAVFRLRRGEEHGWLVIDGLAGARVAAAVLGIPGPRAHRRMGTTERGVFLAVVAAVLRAAPGTTVAVARSSEWSGAGAARVEVAVESSLVRQTLFLDLPLAWIPDVGSAELVMSLRHCQLPFMVAARLAQTILSAAEWTGARPGDAIVFDEPFPGDPAKDGWPFRLALGDFEAPARLGSDGHACLVGNFQVTDNNHRSPMSHDITQPFDHSILASAPIEIVAELGRVVMRAEEVITLQPGSVVTIGRVGAPEIHLRIGDRTWATGELVNVDGALGVRLLSVADPGSSRPPGAPGTVLR